MAARPAESAADQRDAVRVVSRVFRASTSCDWEVALRLGHPRYHDATWWAWSEQGQVVGALVCTPLRWHASTWEAPRAGYMLGALAVLPEHRGRDIGRSLTAAVMLERSEAGAGLGLIFAGIAPSVYTPLGFRTRRASTLSVPTPLLLALPVTPSTLTPLNPYSNLEELAHSWRRAHQGCTPVVYVHRDPLDARRSLARAADDVFFTVSGSGASSGILRLRDLPEADAVEVVECVLEVDNANANGSIQSALAAVASLARGLGRSRVVGWWPGIWGDPAEVLGIEGVMQPHPVPPMTVGLDTALPLVVWASDEL